MTDEKTVERADPTTNGAAQLPTEWFTTPMHLPEGYHVHAWGEGPVHGPHSGSSLPHDHLNDDRFV